MAEVTGISWCDRTWSPWIGCQKVSPACDGCYAEHMMATRMGRVVWGPHGERQRTSEEYWRKPLAWNREGAKAGKRITVFPSLCDPFDNRVDPAWRRDWFELIRSTPHLLWLVLTKRPQNIVRMVKEVGFMPSNIAFGTTVEDLARKKQNLPALTVAAGLRPAFLFASFEPLLEDLGDLSPWLSGDPRTQVLAEGERWERGFKIGADGWPKLPALGLVITGGETDQGSHMARPTHPEWILSIAAQCAAHGTPYHHKQHGEWLPVRWMGEDLHDAIHTKPPRRDPEAIRRCKVDSTVMHRDGSLHPDPAEAGAYAAGSGAMLMFKVGKKRSGRLLDGALHNAMPEVLAHA